MSMEREIHTQSYIYLCYIYIIYLTYNRITENYRNLYRKEATSGI